MAAALALALLAAATSRTVDGWGVVTDPDGDCDVKLVGGELRLGVPATPHNLNPRLGRLNGVRVLRPVAGDFTLTVKVAGKFEPGGKLSGGRGTVPFVGAGLLLWADRERFVRVERTAWVLPDGRRLGYPPLVELFAGDEWQVFSRPPVPPGDFLGGGDVWLRLDRAGDAFTVRVGTDGRGWQTAAEFAAELPARVQVRVAAVNTSDAPFAVRFGGLKLAADD